MKVTLLSCFCTILAQAGDVLTPVDQLGVAGFQHADDISEIKVLSDGKRVLSSSQDGTARLWDLESGKLIRSFSSKVAYDVWGIALREGEEELIAGGGGGTIVRYEVETGKTLSTYKHGDTVFRVALHPNGKWFVAGDSGSRLKLWDIEKGTEVRDFKGHGADVYTVIFNADGSRIISGDDDGEVKLWDAETGECLKTLAKDKKFKDIFTFTRSPDGDSFAMISDDKKVRAYTCDTLKQLWEVPFKKGGQVLDWSPDGKTIAVASGDESLELISAKTGKSIKTIPTGDASHTPVAFSLDGSQLISGGENHLHIYDIETGERVIPGGGLPVVTQSIRQLAVSNDGSQVFAGGNQDEWLQWERGAETRVKIHKVAGDVTALTLSPDGLSIAVGSANGGVTIYDGKSGELLRKMKGGMRMEALDFSPGGSELVGAGMDDVAVLWSAESGKVLRKFEGHTNDIMDVAISKDGLILVTTGEDKTTKVWNLNSGARLANLEMGKNAAHALALLGEENSILLAVDEPGLIGRLLKPRAEPVPLDEERLKVLVEQLADSSFRKRDEATKELAAMGGEVLDRLDKAAKEDPEVRSRIKGVANLITGVVDKDALKEVAELNGDIETIVSNSDQTLWAAVVGSGATGEIVVGEVVDQEIKILQTIVTGNSPVGLAFSPNGKFLVAGNGDGTVDLFAVTP